MPNVDERHPGHKWRRARGWTEKVATKVGNALDHKL